MKRFCLVVCGVDRSISTAARPPLLKFLFVPSGHPLSERTEKSLLVEAKVSNTKEIEIQDKWKFVIITSTIPRSLPAHLLSTASSS